MAKTKERPYDILDFDAEFSPNYEEIDEQLKKRGLTREDLPIYVDERPGDFGKKLARELIDGIKKELDKVDLTI